MIVLFIKLISELKRFHIGNSNFLPFISIGRKSSKALTLTIEPICQPNFMGSINTIYN